MSQGDQVEKIEYFEKQLSCLRAAEDPSGIGRVTISVGITGNNGGALTRDCWESSSSEESLSSSRVWQIR